MKNKTYDVRIQDFTPFGGSLIYQRRNLERKDENGKNIQPEPYSHYFTTLVALAGLNGIEIMSLPLIVQGLEFLIK